MLDYPAAALFEFCDNHGLLQLTDRPQWRTVRGGSRRYVERLLADIPQVRLGCAVTRVARDDAGVMVEDVHGGRLRYDAVVLASHSDQSAALLADASDEERRQLAAVRYQPNRAVLHTDTRLLPRRVSLWSAWNFHAGAGSPASRPVCVSYLINRLQPLPMARPVIVSLNPVLEPRADTVIGSFDYAHPVFDAAAVSVRRSIEAVQGNRNTWFCGAWLGHGFHEDGLASAVRVARALGVEAPWSAGAAAAEAA
jgi:predicted NAD/FAD-binding protein